MYSADGLFGFRYDIYGLFTQSRQHVFNHNSCGTARRHFAGKLARPAFIREPLMRIIRHAALYIVLSAFPAFAFGQTDTFTVTAEVIKACNLTANDLDFGNYNPISGSNLDGASTVEVTCSNGTSYAVQLSAGGGTLANRLMTDSTNNLQYNLYTSAARTTIWGDGTGATATVPGTGSGTLQTLDVYGRVPASQNIPIGTYTDSITAEVTF